MLRVALDGISCRMILLQFEDFQLKKQVLSDEKGGNIDRIGVWFS